MGIDVNVFAPLDMAHLEPAAPPKLEASGLNFYYGTSQSLMDVHFSAPARRVSALIGPSGCGKSTLLRVFNRMYSIYPRQRAEGHVLLDGEDVLSTGYTLGRLRSKVGMVFQKPVPFPMSIFENVAYAIRHYESLSKADLAVRVEEALKRAALWDEVKDKLGYSALGLSGGQQQRLCIARAVALKPEVLLLDEPTSALDPISTAKVEELVDELKADHTVLIVTHSMQQAARVSDFCTFMFMGRVIESGTTSDIFKRPVHEQTLNYITGRFG